LLLACSSYSPVRSKSAYPLRIGLTALAELTYLVRLLKKELAPPVEKRKAHYPLAAIKQALANKQVRVTVSALQGAFALGLLDGDIWDAVEGLKPGDFYKSMTAHQDHRVWQDVYHAQVADRVVYVKIQYVTEPKGREGYWVISFKEK